MKDIFLFSHATVISSILCAQVQRCEIVRFSVLDYPVWTILFIQLSITLYGLYCLYSFQLPCMDCTVYTALNYPVWTVLFIQL
jgi:hypothetical protein